MAPPDLPYNFYRSRLMDWTEPFLFLHSRLPDLSDVFLGLHRTGCSPTVCRWNKLFCSLWSLKALLYDSRNVTHPCKPNHSLHYWEGLVPCPWTCPHAVRGTWNRTHDLLIEDSSSHWAAAAPQRPWRHFPVTVQLSSWLQLKHTQVDFVYYLADLFSAP